MEVIPAIDIRDGRCVRLTQGDYARETIFSEDPAAVARRWQDLGAPRLHLVDLDGAREGRPVNTAAVESILSGVSIPTQLGGGLRDLISLQLYATLGVDRLVLGTAALKDRALLQAALERFGGRVAVALDARDGLVAAEGWLETSTVAAPDLARELAALGVARFIYTDIQRDGTLGGPNLAAIEVMLAVLRDTPSALIASGGVSRIEHLQQLASLGVEGVIVGKALYTGDIDLAAALRTVQ